MTTIVSISGKPWTPPATEPIDLYAALDDIGGKPLPGEKLVEWFRSNGDRICWFCIGSSFGMIAMCAVAYAGRVM